MKKQFLECGKIVAIHALKGEVRVQSWCDTPDFLTQLCTLYLDEQGEKLLEVERARVHKGLVILKVAGVDTPEDASNLRGKVLFMNRADAPLADGEYFVQDLLGCTVVDADTNVVYGSLYDIQSTGANDVYYLRDEQGVVRLVPAIPDVVLTRDPDAGVITIRPLEGLFDA